MFSEIINQKKESVIPWARPEAWEGAPSIPGLISQE
jgi:hypothetical protein